MFIWKNIKSDDMDIIVESMPSIDLPVEKIEEVNVEGMSGFYTINTGAYEGTTKMITVHYTGDKYDELAEWLSGSGELILGNLKDRYYKAYISNSIPLDVILEAKLAKFPIKFRCQPFGYSLNNDLITLKITNTIINNSYTHFSEPVIKVYGNGDINLFINGKQISLKLVEEYITINSTLKDCYKDLDKLNNKMIGEYPILLPGKNTISWTGSVNKIEITPNWRYKL